MQAIQVARAGGADELRLVTVAAPKPGPGQILVKTAFSGVNFIEIYQRSGVYHVQYPFAIGSEASGTVIALGEGVTQFSVGDRIATSAATGTYAEEFVVAADQAAHVPDGVDLETAAALPLQGATAHYLANSASHPVAGDVVLIHAGAGGVGLLLTQLLVSKGVRVLTTASTQDKRELSLAAGAEASVGYEESVGLARAATDGNGVAVVYDGVGKTTFDDSLDSLRIRGELVLFGGSSGQVPPFDLQRLNAGGSLSITRPSLGHFMRTKEERDWRYAELFAAVAAGTLQTRIGATFQLADAAKAHTALEARATAGKVLLQLRAARYERPFAAGCGAPSKR